MAYRTTCIKAGISPLDFWNIGLETSAITIKAYNDRVNAQWQHTRLIVYTTACTVTEPDNREELYDFMPLKGDPTMEERIKAKEQIKKSNKAAAEKEIEKMREFNEQLRKEKTDKRG